jgi:hypothetical protein
MQWLILDVSAKIAVDAASVLFVLSGMMGNSNKLSDGAWTNPMLLLFLISTLVLIINERSNTLFAPFHHEDCCS